MREIKKNLSISLPLILTNMIFSLSGFVGTAMVAKLGEAALAASILVSMMWSSLTILFIGVLHAICVLVAHQFGARNETAIREIMGQSYILGLCISLAVILVLLGFQFILEWSGQPDAVLKIAYQYLHALMWTVPSLVLWIILEQFLLGIGQTKLVLRVSLLVVPVEIPLIYALIFGKWGLPVCGVSGIGYGFTATYTISVIGLVVYLLFAQPFRSYEIFSAISIKHLQYMKEILRVGLPLGLMQVIEISAFAVATYWIGHFDTAILAAHQIVFQYLGFAIVIVLGMSQAVTIRVGYEVGRQNLAAIKEAVLVGMFLGFCAVSIIAFLFYAFPNALIGFDVDVLDKSNIQLIENAEKLFSIAAVLIVFDNFRIIGFGALRGLKDTQFSMVTSLVGFWGVGLSMAYLLGFNMQWLAQGIWWGLTLGILAGAFLVLSRLRTMVGFMSPEELKAISQVNGLN